MPEETSRQEGSIPEEERVHGKTGPEESRYSSARARAEYVSEQMRSAAREVFDTILRRVPPDVVEHVGNSGKELLLAVRSLIDKELESINRCSQHARDLHKPKETEETAPKA